MSAKAPTPASEGCPRCGAAFHCGINDAEACACTSISLDAATQAHLRQRYSGCLCLGCLRSLAAGASPGPSSHGKHRA
jgi:hypothetical protein